MIASDESMLITIELDPEPSVVTTYAGAVVNAGLYVVDAPAKATPLLLKVIVCPLTTAVVLGAFKPIAKLVPATTAIVGSIVTTTPLRVMVLKGNVAAWTSAKLTLSVRISAKVLPPAITAVGATVNVCPAMVTKAVDEPVGSATFEPPMYTEEDPTWTGTPATKVTVADAAPTEVATATAVENGELNAELMMLPRPLPPGDDTAP